ncbi:MAG: acyl-CoA dehydrogenase family protein, partial [Nitrososphaerales archaeon]
WFGVNVPAEYGGAGLGHMECSIVMHEASRSGAGSSANILLSPYLVAKALTYYGTKEAKEKFLPDLAKGKLVCCIAVTEPNAGVDTLSITTSAVKQNGEYVINGQKIWITLAHLADLMILLTRTTPADKVKRRTQGLSVFLVELKKQRPRIVRIEDIVMRTNSSNEVFFEDLRVPEENLLGQQDNGWEVLTSIFNLERVLTASMSIGIGELALNKAVKYANERIVFGRPIGQNQGIQFPLAEAKMLLESSWLMVQKAAWLLDKNKMAAFETNTAAFLAARAANYAADRAMQTYGGMAYARDNDVERYWRDARLLRSGPIPEEMTLNFVAANVLRLPKSY